VSPVKSAQKRAAPGRAATGRSAKKPAADRTAGKPAANGDAPGADAIQLAISGGVAVITLNRPAKLNAFAGDMRGRLVDALDRVAADRDVRVLVITGAGKAFCSGGDVQHMVELKARGSGYEAIAPLLELGRAIVTRLAALEMPVIAAVNGVAAGAGLNLALACDVRIASSEARFAESFVKLGLHPDWGGTFHLPRLAGTAAALDLCWTGEAIDGAAALRLGLVQRVVPAAAFGRSWRAYAGALAAAPITSVRAAKRTLRAALARTLEQCLDAEAEAQTACWASTDSAEGLAAFAEKRAPRFGGEPVEEDSRPPSRAARRFE